MTITIEEYTKGYPIENAHILGKTKKSDTLEYTTIIRMKNCIVRVTENAFKNPRNEIKASEFIRSIEEKIVKSKKLSKQAREIGMMLTYETLPAAEPPKPKKKQEEQKKDDEQEKKPEEQEAPEVVTGEVVDDKKK